jgi:hypothetical protein
MRVLFAEKLYPQISESYIAAEIAFCLKAGVKVEVWSLKEPISTYPEQVKTHRGSFQEAVSRFKPDVVHVHFLDEIDTNLDYLVSAGIPVTIRGHSVDHSPDRLLKKLEIPWVKKAYLFPHFAKGFPGHPKVTVMPATYDPALYYPETKARSLVVRAGAGLPYKGLADFIRVASMVEGKTFVLIASTNVYFPNCLPDLRSLNESLGSPVDIRNDLQHAEAAAIVRRAGVMFHTSDPSGHPFGMPVSTLEGMAAGCYTLIRGSEGASGYIAPHGSLYRSVDEAAALIRQTEKWTDERWAEVEKSTAEHVKQFAEERWLPIMIKDWESLWAATSEIRS